jgi:hypothetical protein
MSVQAIKALVLIGLMALFGFICYRAGYKISENTYLIKERAAAFKLEKITQESINTEIALQDEREKKQQVKTQIITKVKREIIQLPARDCGWSPAERLHIQSAYCASFPTTADCMSKSVPDTSRTSRGRPEYKPALMGDPGS